MGDESLVGVVNLVSGEKDPRNLMLIFSMLRVLMVEWDISAHIELMFDSVYAYFPITFRPPPNDPYGITAQDLKDRLRDCLSCTGNFAPHTFPNMLDRLDSTSNPVKKDVLATLSACATNYDPKVMSQYSITLWDAVKFEVLQAQEPELSEEALNVLQSISGCLSQLSTTDTPTSPLLQYLRPINKECLEHLQQPASRQAKASGDILKAVSSASLPAFEIVIKTVGPSLLTLYQSAEGLVHQRAVLEFANKLFEAALEVYGSWTTTSQKNPGGRENILSEFKDKLVTIYSQALMGTVKEEVSYRLTAATGLLLISKMSSLLPDNEIGLFVQYFDDIVLKEESYSRDELKTKSMSALAEISKFKPTLISDITFPAFMACLPDDEEAAGSTDYRSVLGGLAEISVEKTLLETLMRRLLNKLDILFNSAQRSSYPYTMAILGAILYVLNKSVVEQQISLDTYYERVVVGLSQRTAEARKGPLTDENVTDLLGRIMNLIVRRSSKEAIQRAGENIYSLFRGPQNSQNPEWLATPMEADTTTILSTWLLAAIPRRIPSPLLTKSQIPQTINGILSITSQCRNKAILQNLLSQISLYVNKHLETADLSFVDTLLSNTLDSLKDEPMGDIETHDFDIRLIFGLIRPLVLRLAPKTNQYLVDLVDLLDQRKYPNQVSQTAATGFSTILAPDDILSKTNDAQIRLLAPQRVFQTLTPLISDKFRSSQSPLEKENYLVALSGVLATVPSDIVMPELPTLLPLLLQSLDITDQVVKMATLETLAIVITSNPSALDESGHIPALVKRLLSVASVPKVKKSAINPETTKVSQHQIPEPPLATNLPKTRRLATRCLTLLPKYITESTSRVNPLLALKRTVLHGLTGVLDDNKRDVRKEAVDARAAWLRGVDDVDDVDDED